MIKSLKALGLIDKKPSINLLMHHLAVLMDMSKVIWAINLEAVVVGAILNSVIFIGLGSYCAALTNKRL